MKTTKPPLIFFGNEQLASGVSLKPVILESLIEAGYPILALVLRQGTITSRKLKVSLSEELAKKHQIPVLKPESSSEMLEMLQPLKAEAGILAAYGRIIPSEVINLFSRGIINIHPSVLPQYRGSTPIEQAILAGAAETGVSIMKLAAAMDAGPIFAQKTVKISQKDTKQQLAESLQKIGRQLLLNKLPKILSGELSPRSQNDKAATYTTQIKKSDGVMDWRKPARQLEREVRAYAGWPQSATDIWGKNVVITRAHSVPTKPDQIRPGHIEVLEQRGIIMIYAHDGYICLEKVKPAGKKEMAVADFIRGYYRA